jgi:hypothetical protein
MQKKGFIVSEHPAFGIVHRVHSATSLHYEEQALDVNHNVHSANDAKEWNTESEALNWLYRKIMQAAKNHKWPLDEMFFNGHGFLKETPLVNHAIGGHDGHLHIAFQKKEW